MVLADPIGIRPSLHDPARDPRDEAALTPPATTGSPTSPYALTPAIDFDGLSWPCEYFDISRSQSVC